MLKIILIVIILYILIGLPMILIIIGGSKNKSEEEIRYEEQEEIEYCKKYIEEKNRKRRIRKIRIRRFFGWIKNFILGNR